MTSRAGPVRAPARDLVFAKRGARRAALVILPQKVGLRHARTVSGQPQCRHWDRRLVRGPGYKSACRCAGDRSSAHRLTAPSLRGHRSWVARDRAVKLSGRGRERTHRATRDRGRPRHTIGPRRTTGMALQTLPTACCVPRIANRIGLRTAVSIPNAPMAPTRQTHPATTRPIAYALVQVKVRPATARTAPIQHAPPTATSAPPRSPR
jgi:hypothetical protein